MSRVGRAVASVTPGYLFNPANGVPFLHIQNMKKDKIYISGPISSRPLGVAINHFMLAEAKLQAQGYRTCNPLKMRLCVWLAQHGHYRLCLWLQLLWMSATCQCIYLLDGWHTSDGARAERAVARVMGITALYEQKREKTSKKHKKD